MRNLQVPEEEAGTLRTSHRVRKQHDLAGKLVFQRSPKKV